MSQIEPPRSVIPTEPAQTRGVPGWVFVLVIVLCLAGGSAFIWWFFAASPTPRIEVVLKESAAGQDDGQDAGPPRRPRARSQEFPPLPEGAIPAGTRITGEWVDTPLHEVLRALPKPPQAEVIVSHSSARSRGITLKVQDQPFWAVLCDIAHQANLQLYSPHGRPNQIMLQDSAGPVRPPAAIHGPFMITLQRIDRNRTIYLANGGLSNRLTLRFSLAVEPGTPVNSVVRLVMLEEVIDQSGNPLSQDNTSSADAHELDRQWEARLAATLPIVDSATRLARLRGHVSALAADSTEPFEIDDPLNHAGRVATIELTPVTNKWLGFSLSCGQAVQVTPPTPVPASPYAASALAIPSQPVKPAAPPAALPPHALRLSALSRAKG